MSRLILPRFGVQTPMTPPTTRTALLAGLIILLIGAGALPTFLDDRLGDLWHYFQVSNHLLRGERPYQDFRFEYPPLALLALVLPRLALLGHPVTFHVYLWGLVAENALLSTALGLVLLRLTRRHRFGLDPNLTMGLYLILLVVTSLVLPWRYDMLPTLLSALAFAAVLDRKPLPAGLWLGLGIAAKLYPVVLLPVFGLYYLTQRRGTDLAKMGAGCAGALALCLLPFATMPPRVFLSFLQYHQLRGLEIGSVPAGLLLLAHAGGLTHVSVVLNYGALHLVSLWAPPVIHVLPFLFLVAYGVTLARCRAIFRAEAGTGEGIRPESLAGFVVAALLAFIVANKVFSPQYVIWLLPFAPLLRPRRALSLAVIFALTTAVYPLTFPALVAQNLAAVLLLNLRNALTLGFWGLLALPPVARILMTRPETTAHVQH